MPHSSGGGSHRSGSHHSSSNHHSSRHSSGPSRCIRDTYFPGSKRYRYYYRNEPAYVYANYDIRKPRGKIRFLAILFYVQVIVMLMLIGIRAVHSPKPISTNYNTDIVISDNAHVLNDTETLENSLTAFLDKTGITPSVFTVYNEEWQDKYDSLETYAYSLYVDAFPDESHWLIVYSQPEVPDADFNDWYWEGMQGNDTDGVITSEKANEFNSVLHRYFTDNSISVSDAISRAFDELTPEIMKKSVQTPIVIFILICIIFLCMHCCLLVIHDPSKKYRDAEICLEDDSFPIEEKKELR